METMVNDRHCPRCGFKVGGATWCMDCGWRDETQPPALRRLNGYLLVAFVGAGVAVLVLMAGR
jgi:anaerobic ribonucleoside-triphosphate reductase